MQKIIQAYSVRAINGMAFFLFGFFTIAKTLDMSLHETLIGLGAGAIGGMVMLVVAAGSSIEMSPALRKRFWREA